MPNRMKQLNDMIRAGVKRGKPMCKVCGAPLGFRRRLYCGDSCAAIGWKDYSTNWQRTPKRKRYSRRWLAANREKRRVQDRECKRRNYALRKRLAAGRSGR